MQPIAAAVLAIAAALCIPAVAGAHRTTATPRLDGGAARAPVQSWAARDAQANGYARYEISVTIRRSRRTTDYEVIEVGDAAAPDAGAPPVLTLDEGIAADSTDGARPDSHIDVRARLVGHRIKVTY
jgi:hypothetical protein